MVNPKMGQGDYLSPAKNNPATSDSGEAETRQAPSPDPAKPSRDEQTLDDGTLCVLVSQLRRSEAEESSCGGLAVDMETGRVHNAANPALRPPLSSLHPFTTVS